MLKILILCMVLIASGLQASTTTHKLRYSAANNITFKASQQTKEFVGSGFILSHQGQQYAVTAKHVLLEIMDQGIDHIAVADHVEKWLLKPFNEDAGVVELGTLMNADKSEKLGIEALQNDWLIFSIKSNTSNLTPVKIASQRMTENDEVAIYGCNYHNQKSCQQEVLNGKYVKSLGRNHLIKMKIDDMSQLRGLSGAPVLNSQFEVVGIVSNVLPDRDNGGMYFAPFVIEPVKAFIEQLEKQ